VFSRRFGKNQPFFPREASIVYQKSNTDIREMIKIYKIMYQGIVKMTEENIKEKNLNKTMTKNTGQMKKYRYYRLK
jgi:hypothetical protein